MERSLIEPSFEPGLEVLEFEKMFESKLYDFKMGKTSFSELMLNYYYYYYYFKSFNKIIKINKIINNFLEIFTVFGSLTKYP
jgi:hypothetical protein